MDVGTIDVVDDKPKRKRRRSSSLLGGSGGGRNGGRRGPGGGGGGGGGDENGGDPGPLQRHASKPYIPEKARILTAFLLLVVMMTFGGLIAAYVVIATNGVAEWRPFSLPTQVWISTAIILLSSLTYHAAKRATDRNAQFQATRWLLATTVLGAAFISSQVIVWLLLSARGLYLSGNPYAGFFYILTAVHAVHVIGGITALGAVLLRTWYPTDDLIEILRRRSLAQVVGWYWHFMGVLWIVIFVLLGFWK